MTPCTNEESPNKKKTNFKITSFFFLNGPVSHVVSLRTFIRTASLPQLPFYYCWITLSWLRPRTASIRQPVVEMDRKPFGNHNGHSSEPVYQPPPSVRTMSIYCQIYFPHRSMSFPLFFSLCFLFQHLTKFKSGGGKTWSHFGEEVLSGNFGIRPR